MRDFFSALLSKKYLKRTAFWEVVCYTSYKAITTNENWGDKMEEALTVLRNGSDIRGVAIATEEFPATLTPEAMTQIANGIVYWLRKNDEEKYLAGKLMLGIGQDSRISGDDLKAALVQQLVLQGIQVIDFQLATTPAMFMSTRYPEFDCDAAIMLTASHLPFYYNGAKLFTRSGGAEKEDIQVILTHPQVNENGQVGIVKQAQLLPKYSADLLEKIRRSIGEKQPLLGWKIVVDAGNGAGGFFVKILQELGADTTGSQFLTPDGMFPNHIPNPDNAEAMASIKEAVLANQADLGIIFDTDVDRAAVVTASGQALNRNNLIAVLSKIILKEHPGTSIVTNSPTSDHLRRFIENAGGKQVRYISGYRNVINKAIQLNEQGIDSQLAIETSGHAAFKENYFLDDGAYVIAKLLMLLPDLKNQGQTLDTLIQELQQPAETVEVRFPLKAVDYHQLGEKVIEQLGSWKQSGWHIDSENEEGIRIRFGEPFGNGWFLLRMSLHEPLLVLQVENDVAGKLSLILRKLQEFLEQFPEVDQEKLLSKLN